MYLNKSPKVLEIVFVRLSDKTSGKLGNYVDLVEYNDLEGLILCTEITKYKSNLKSIVKRDEIFPVVVLNNDRGIDLSYSKIKIQSRELLKSSYDYQSMIFKLINTTSNELKIDDAIKAEILNNNLYPEIYTECIMSNTNLPKVLYESILKNPEKLFEKISEIDESTINKFCNTVKSKIIVKPYHVEMDFKLCVFENDSLTKLKDLLDKIKNLTNKINNDNNNIKCDLMCKSSPVYQLKIIGEDIEIINTTFSDLNIQITNIVNDYNVLYEYSNKSVIVKELEYILN